MIRGRAWKGLRELEKYSARAFGVHKSDARAASSYLRLFIDQLCACAFQAIKFRHDVVDSDANVMQTWSAAFKKFADWSVWR